MSINEDFIKESNRDTYKKTHKNKCLKCIFSRPPTKEKNTHKGKGHRV